MGSIFRKYRKYFFWGGIGLLATALAVCISQVGQPESAPSWECPLTVMYESTYYVRAGSKELRSLDGMEQVGTVQSCVSSTQMPEENYQTNVEFLLNQIIWEKDDFLYIQSNEERVYWIFAPKNSD